MSQSVTIPGVPMKRLALVAIVAAALVVSVATAPNADPRAFPTLSVHQKSAVMQSVDANGAPYELGGESITSHGPWLDVIVARYELPLWSIPAGTRNSVPL